MSNYLMRLFQFLRWAEPMNGLSWRNKSRWD